MKNGLLILIPALLFTVNSVFAGDTYKNNVVDVKINKETSKAVKVTIYTDKPYTEPVVVNKKANNKYIILMPETKSSLITAPEVSNASGTISNVSVRTHDVAGGKGYTKIVITSEKAVTIVPITQQLAAKSITSDTEKKSQQDIKKSVFEKKETDTITSKKAAESKKTVTETKPIAAKPKQTAAKKNIQPKPKPKQIAVRKVPVSKKVQTGKTISQKLPPPAPQPKPASAKKMQPIEILEREIKTNNNAKLVMDNNDAVLKREIRDNIRKNELRTVNVKNSVNETNDNQSVLENLRTVIKDYNNIAPWKLLLLIGAIAFPLIVIMIILGLDKKINLRIDKLFKKEEAENMPVGQSASIFEPVRQPYNSFDEMLDKVDEVSPPFHEKQLYNSQYSKYEQSVIQTQKEEVLVEDKPAENAQDAEMVDEFKSDFVKDDFEHDFNKEAAGTVQEPDSSGTSAQPLQAKEQPAAPIQQEPYNPDGYLSDFSNVNDKEFFEELVLQTMAENNASGLPEESPADKMFDGISAPLPEPMNNQPARNDSIEENTAETNNADDTEQTDSVTEFSDMTAAETPQNTDIPTQNDELNMLTEVKLNDNTGMYLVNYENSSSLVGHINEDYFVIKKFDTVTNGNITFKLTEKLQNSSRYIVRVGKNKMVVEVSDTSMSKLLDL